MSETVKPAIASPLASLAAFGFILAAVAGTVGSAEPIAPILTIEEAGRGVVFSPDGKRLVANVPGKTRRPTDIKIWEIDAGKEKEVVLLQGHTSNIWQLSFSPDGKRLATNENYVVKVWDLERAKEVTSFKTSAFTRAVVFTHDGQRVATGDDNGRIIIWDVGTSERIRVLKGHGDWVVGLALSPDGKQLASASVDLTARLWDLDTGKTVRTLQGHTWYLNCVAFSPHGKRLITGADDMTARVWDSQTGKELLTLRGHKDWVVRAAYSPDGKWLATGSGDHTARIWNASTGKEVHTIAAHTDTVSGLAFSPDGKLLATAGQDNKIRLWAVSSFEE